MNIIAFQENGKYKAYESKKKIKSSKFEYVLIKLRSALYGSAYLRIELSTFTKLRKMTNVKYKYRFLDGTYIDKEDECLWTMNRYEYNNGIELFSKIAEILINEVVFDKLFWIYSSEMSYCFDMKSIEFTYGDKKYKFTDYDKFYKFLGIKESLFKNRPEYIELSKKRYTERKDSEYKKFDKDNMLLIHYGWNIYFEFNSKLIKKFKDIKISEKLKLVDDSCEEEVLCHKIEHKPNSLYQAVDHLLMCRFANECVSKLVNFRDDLWYKFKSFVSFKKGKKQKINKVAEKYFPSVPKGDYYI